METPSKDGFRAQNTECIARSFSSRQTNFARFCVYILPNQGKANGSAVKVADLTCIHNFDTPLSGSNTIHILPVSVAD